MGFVEAMVDRGLRARPSRTGRSSRCRSRGSPSTRHGTVRIRQARPPLRDGARRPGRRARRRCGSAGVRLPVFDDALVAGGRVKAIVAPGLGGATRREIDELDRAPPGGSGRRVSSMSRSRPMAARIADREVPRPRTGATGSSPRSAPRRAISSSSWPTRRRRRPTSSVGCRSTRRRAARPGRPRRPGLLLGPPLPDVPVGRGGAALGRDPQPVQRGRARGRGPADDRLAATRPKPSPERSGRPGAGAAVRSRPQRLGARRRHRSGSIDASCSSGASRSRARPPTGCGRSSARCSTRSSTAHRRTAGSPSASIAGR